MRLCPKCEKDPDPRGWSACFSCRALNRGSDLFESFVKVRVLLGVAEDVLLEAANRAPGVTLQGDVDQDVLALHRELRKALDAVRAASVKSYSVFPAE